MSQPARPSTDQSWRRTTLGAYLSTLSELTGWRIWLSLALMLCLSLAEGVGLVLLIPLLSLVGLDIEIGPLGRLPRLLFDAFQAVGLQPTLATVLVIYVVIIGGHALLNRWQAIVSLDLQETLMLRLRQKLFRSIANANWLFLARSRASDFTHALTTELNRVALATNQLLGFLVNTVVVSVYLLFALQLSPSITLVVLASGAVLWALVRGQTRSTRLSGQEISVATTGLYAAAIEHFGGMKTIKSYGAQDRTAAILSKVSESIARIYAASARTWVNAKLWFDVGAVVILSLAVYAAVELLEMPVGSVLLLLFLFARLMPKFTVVQQAYQHFLHGLPAFRTVMELQARCDAAAEPLTASAADVDLRDGIRLEAVSFAYAEAGEPLVLDELDLSIPAGRTTAIVAPSGAGKSTIADLVLGLIRPDRGRLLIDGTPLTPELVQAWRDKIGYVAQDTFLFHDTVRANLRWACPEASDEDVWEALRLGAADGFVTRLPDGVETIVGDRGVLLSGGERQRLALARALLRRPSLLVLDEATSNLDAENEQRIQAAIEGLHGSVTMLVLTHRLSAIRRADLIYVLDQGRVIEAGTWTDLLRNGRGRFRALCQAQGLVA